MFSRLLLSGCAIFAFIFPFCNRGNAGFVLSIESNESTFQIPLSGIQEITFNVFLNADAGTQLLRGYTLPLDLAPPGGIGLPTGITFGSASVVTALPGNPEFSGRSGLDGGDFVVQDGGTPVEFGTSRVGLFDFTLSVAPDAAEGDYSISVIDNASLLFLDDQGNEIDISSTGAMFQLSAVPEPSSLGLLGILMVGLRMRPRRCQ